MYVVDRYFYLQLLKMYIELYLFQTSERKKSTLNIDEHFLQFFHRVETRFMYHLSKSERKT